MALFVSKKYRSCTKCDFAVVDFQAMAWASSADYMFFRNFYPNEERLSAKMLLATGKTAKCCQCSWATVADGEDDGTRQN